MTSSPKNIVQDTELTDKMQFLIDCLDNGNDTEFFVVSVIIILEQKIYSL